MALIMTHTRLCIDDTREMWSKPIDLFSLLSLPILNVPLAANDDDVDSARYGGPMWCWRQAQIGPHLDTYEVEVSL